MSARDCALQVVRDVFPGQPGPERGAQEALDYRARKLNLDVRDRAFATQLAYGSIKARRTLDWYLQSFIGERPQPPPAAIHEILRLAIYELVYTRADEHATVFEFVNLAKRYGHRGVANLVNAVLRSFLRDRPVAPTRDLFDSTEEYLGVAYSLPTWLTRQWGETFGDRTEDICAAVNDPAQAAITVNGLVGDRASVIERLEAAGTHAEASRITEDSILLEDASYAHARERDAKGAWWIQSESSAMPVGLLNVQEGESALDVCSGRGNKALQSGVRLAGSGSLTCVERDERKAGVLQTRLADAGIAASVVVGDATAELLDPSRRFDRILIDAPCSGTGVLGRHPEARWKKQPGDGERLSGAQSALLEAFAPHVFEGGVMVYAVCTTDPRETNAVVERFLASHNFERGLVPEAYGEFLTGAGDVLVPPGLEGRDGFYIARLQRRT